jgi:hypothetical protein
LMENVLSSRQASSAAAFMRCAKAAFPAALAKSRPLTRTEGWAWAAAATVAMTVKVARLAMRAVKWVKLVFLSC